MSGDNNNSDELIMALYSANKDTTIFWEEDGVRHYFLPHSVGDKYIYGQEVVRTTTHTHKVSIADLVRKDATILKKTDGSRLQ
ncbi:hypothetical protein HY212_02730 [Candidatus Pacearchaeota archaeon]|nr:hypothetical protein [Candidatus Pacearchaeota archaeon]